MTKTAYLLFVAFCASGAPTVTSMVSCSANGSNQASATSCFIPLAAPLFARANASFNSSFTLSGNTLTTAIEGQAYAAPSALSGASATSSGSLTDELDTAGVVRLGLMTVFSSLTASSFDGSAVSRFSVGAASGFCVNQLSMSPQGCPTGSGIYPITLGQPFSFSESQQSDPLTTIEPDGSEAGTNITIRFFEADGVTPVNVFEVTPEPSALWLTIAGVGLLAAGRHSLKRKQLLRVWPKRILPNGG